MEIAIAEACRYLIDPFTIIHTTAGIGVIDVCYLIADYSIDVEMFESILLRESANQAPDLRQYGRWLNEVAERLQTECSGNTVFENWRRRALEHYRKFPNGDLQLVLKIHRASVRCQRSTCFAAQCICRSPLIFKIY